MFYKVVTMYGTLYACDRPFNKNPAGQLYSLEQVMSMKGIIIDDTKPRGIFYFSNIKKTV